MIKNQRIALIIPFLNEEKHIYDVVIKIPNFVDKIILVNDGSNDNSLPLVKTAIENLNDKYIEIKKSELNIWEVNNIVNFEINSRFIIVNHQQNLGKGAGIKTGYILSKLLQIDCIATMDSDGQMAPDELGDICAPIISKEADYSKGNRLAHPQSDEIIPFFRKKGIHILSFITRCFSGYKILEDAQSGYTAISLNMLNKLNINDIYDKYGYVNDIIIRLSCHNGKIKEIPITPIYSKDRISKMNILTVIPKISYLLLKLLFMKKSLSIRNF